MSSNPVLPEPEHGTWRPMQAYLFAVVCLIVGLPIGYFIRGSAQPGPKPVEAAAVASVPATKPEAPPPSAVAPAEAPRQMPTLDDMKRMADKQVQPLLAQLKQNPTDPVLLNKVAMYYKAAHQFEQAAGYFKMALRADPKNVAVRDDYASCLYYSGHVDGAIEQLQKSLTYAPNHPGTLFNLGMIKWKGKGDVDGAVATWEKLLQTNPNFERKEAVQRLIQEAEKSKGAPSDGQKS